MSSLERSPIYPIHVWNVYERTLQDQHRTNNNVEGWNRSFKESCGTASPNIYRFIECLRRQQGLHNYDVVQLIAGGQIAAKNKKYEAISKRLKIIADDADNRTNMEYLQGIAYNFEF